MKNSRINKIFTLLSICVAAIVCMGCGTLAGRSKSAMGIQAESLKTGVSFKVVDKKGAVFASGVTPAVITLPNGALGTNKYTIRYTDKNGQAAEQTVKCTLDTSVLFATVRGFLTVYSFFVDPFTGALFKLPDVATLQEIAYHPGMDIAIASIEDIRPELRRCLIPVGRADITVTTE
jgi:hypothetical protein